MGIETARIERDIEAIAAFSEAEPGVGFSRPTFSPAWRGARDYVVAEAQRAGCEVHVDAAGNMHARPKGLKRDRKVWLSGSHIDSVPTGGKFDGVVGVVAALEVLRAYPAAPMETIIFAEEEGTTFNLGMLGSRAWVGTLSAEALRELRNQAGLDYLAAGARHGVSAERLAGERFDASRYLGFIELHVEQGPGMWNAGQRVAVVMGIHGRRQFACKISGQANHAGSTKMEDRHDALAAAAEMLVAMEDWVEHLNAESHHTVLTVGQMQVKPNAINVIPGEVLFTVDFRAATEELLRVGEALVENQIKRIAARREVGAMVECMEKLPAVPMDADVCGRLKEAAGKLGIGLPEAASGALHDAAIMAPHLPTAMVFIASEGGISHNPAEFSRMEDIVLATRILAEAVQE